MYKVQLDVKIMEYDSDAYVQNVVEKEVLVERFTDRNDAAAFVDRLMALAQKSRKRRQPIVDRFWAKVDKTTHEGGCWIWLASRHKRGYGRLALPGIPPRQIYAHRYSWELHNGPIPAGAEILHKCGNPWCVNPEHLDLW